MSTASGSSRSQAVSDDASSVSSEVVEMLRLLERMDDLVIDAGPDARRRPLVGQPDRPPPATDSDGGDFTLLADAKRKYRDANYNIEQVRIYLLRLPVLDEAWENICRRIQRYFTYSRDQVGVWRLWLRQVERAGTLAWQQALKATASLIITYPREVLAMLNALIKKFAVVDELMDEIHGELYGKKRDVWFSTELDDTLQAKSDIEDKGGVLTAETLRNFKAAIRMKRAAEEAQWTGNHQEPGAGDNQPRRRINAPNPQPVEENQDGVEGQADSSTGSRPDAPHQYNPAVLTIVILLSIASGCLTGFAWTKADHSVGSYDDPDFWLLLQSSILQLAGMAPVVLSLWLSKGVSLQPRLWSWILVVSGALSSALAPILYVAVPKEFSGVIAYVGGVAQAFIVLEAMFLADRAVKQNGAKEKAG